MKRSVSIWSAILANILFDEAQYEWIRYTVRVCYIQIGIESFLSVFCCFVFAQDSPIYTDELFHQV